MIKHLANKKLAISNNGLQLIKHFEGLSLTAYICPAGHPTIGYGHLIQGKDIKRITLEAAENLLINDVKYAERAVKHLVGVRLAQNQFDALVSFVFNLGAFALKRSTLLKRINNNQHEDAPDQLKRWVYGRVNGKMQKLNGLVRRREAEATLYETGELVLG